jgi:hypothetical protein
MASKEPKHKNAKYLKGVYKIQNPKKYSGKNKAFCIYRSSWERTLMHHFDNDPKIKKWCSECIEIPYYFNGKQRRYYPDFLIEDLDGREVLIEVKPFRQTIPPRNSKNKSKKTMIYEQYTYEKNQAKWEAAEKYCTKKGWVFKKFTEKDFRI